MPIGTCRLCGASNVRLLDSHFMCAGFYKIARDGKSSNPNPVLVSTEVSIISSEQARDHLLCAECERRLNERGEDWVLRNCWHDETVFPLRNALVSRKPSMLSTPGFTVFEGRAVPELKAEKLIYFAASIFWRGAAHDWVLMRQTPTRLSLGPYEEMLRQFLLDGAFPENAFLIVRYEQHVADAKHANGVSLSEESRCWLSTTRKVGALANPEGVKTRGR